MRNHTGPVPWQKICLKLLPGRSSDIRCVGLNDKCPHMDIWSLVTGTIWGSYGTFRKRSFPRRSTRLWMGFEGLSLISLPAHTHSLSFHQQTLFLLPCHRAMRMPSLCNHKLRPFFLMLHLLMVFDHGNGRALRLAHAPAATCTRTHDEESDCFRHCQQTTGKHRTGFHALSPRS